MNLKSSLYVLFIKSKKFAHFVSLHFHLHFEVMPSSNSSVNDPLR